MIDHGVNIEWQTVDIMVKIKQNHDDDVLIGKLGVIRSISVRIGCLLTLFAQYLLFCLKFPTVILLVNIIVCFVKKKFNFFFLCD